jgi:site-specific DNA-methyltransferase (adenine-specific)
MEKLKIINGDCLQVMKELSSESIDLVVTSCPYNIGVEYNTYNDKKEDDDYLNWIKTISAEISRILKENGSYFLIVGGTNKDPCIPMRICAKLTEIFHLQNHIIWAKSVSIDHPVVSFGHFKPINSDRFLNNIHESIFHFTKNGAVKLDRLSIGVPFQDKSNIKRFKSNKADKRCRGNIWHIPYKTVKSKTEKFNHPAGFPTELVINCIKLHGYNENTVCLDPFLGCGTTLEACKFLDINGIGIEIDKKYCEITEKRISSVKE